MKDLFTSFAATAVVQLANIASGILAARLLLPEGRGELAAVMLWPALLAAIGGFSLNAATGYLGAGERRPPAEIFAATTALVAVLSPLLVAVGLAIIPEAYRDYRPELQDIARLYLVWVPLNLFVLSYAALLQGQLRFGAFNLLRALQPVSYVVLIGAALVLGYATVGGFAVAAIGGTFVPLVLSVVMVARFGWVGWQAPRAILRAMMRYAATVHVSTVVTVIGQRLDQALIALMLPAADLGLYAVALSAGGLVGIVTAAIDQLAFPKVAAADPTVRAEVLGRYVRLSVALAFATVIVLIPLVPWLLGLLFGPAFVPSAPAARIIAAGMVFHAFRITLYAGLRAYDRALLIGWIEAAVLAAFAAALAALLPRYGIIGGAAALCGSNVLACILLVATVKRALGIGLGTLFTPTAREAELMAELLRRRRSSP